MNLCGKILQLLLVVAITVRDGLTCPDTTVTEPYCSCTALSYGLKMECDGSVVDNGDIIKSMFFHPSLSQAVIAEFYFYDLKVSLPSVVFGDAQIEDMSFSCDMSNFQVALNAFVGQQTRRLSLSKCNLSKTNFTFLEGLGKIEQIQIAYSHTDRLSSFPPCETLNALSVMETPLSQWIPSENVPNLSRLRLEGVGKENVKALMKEVAKVAHLTIVELPRNGLDTVPKELSQMTQLQEVNLEFNSISVLRNHSLHVTAALTYLSFSKCPLTRIEPDAFKGNFSNTQLRLESTELEVFDEIVFKPLLEMKYRNKGSIELAETAFRCDCSIRWLISEYRKFLSHVHNGQCSDGRGFDDLRLEDYDNCQTTEGTTTSVITTTSTEDQTTTSSTTATEDITVSVTTTTEVPTSTTDTSTESSTLTAGSTEPATTTATVDTTTTIESTSFIPTVTSISTTSEETTISTMYTTPTADTTTTVSSTSTVDDITTVESTSFTPISSTISTTASTITTNPITPSTSTVADTSTSTSTSTDRTTVTATAATTSTTSASTTPATPTVSTTISSTNTNEPSSSISSTTVDTTLGSTTASTKETTVPTATTTILHSTSTASTTTTFVPTTTTRITSTTPSSASGISVTVATILLLACSVLLLK